MTKLAATVYRYLKNSGLSSLFLFLLFFLSLSSQLTACNAKTHEQVFAGSIMGTYYRVVVVDETAVNESLGDEIFQVMQRVNQSMSTYISDSEVNQFNRHQTQTWFPLSEQLNAVIAQSLELSVISDGAFDITVAPLVDAWGFGATESLNSPDPQAITMMADYVGYQQLQHRNGQLKKTEIRTSIDLSAIAKGYAVDQVAIYLHQHGYDRFLIDIGGELKASGSNASGEAWRVAVERPYVEGGIARVVLLEDQAIATSGDYRNFIVVDGKHYSHVFDPRTMKPKQHRLASVTIIDDSATLADGLATAMLVMGESAAWAFAIKHKYRAFFMVRTETKEGEPSIQARVTPEFEPYLLQ